MSAVNNAENARVSQAIKRRGTSLSGSVVSDGAIGLWQTQSQAVDVSPALHESSPMQTSTAVTNAIA